MNVEVESLMERCLPFDQKGSAPCCLSLTASMGRGSIYASCLVVRNDTHCQISAFHFKTANFFNEDSKDGLMGIVRKQQLLNCNSVCAIIVYVN